MKRGMVVFFITLIALVGLCPIQGQSETAAPRVWIPEYCGFKMGTVEFSVCMENDTPLKSFVFDLLYDEDTFSSPSFLINERAHGCFMNWTSIEGGVRISATCDSIEAGSGPLVNIRFDEPEGLACGDFVEFTVSGFVLGDADGLSYQYDDMTASLSVRYLGDVTGDCLINVIDALAVVHSILGWDPFGCTLWSIDVNTDDRRNILDILSMIDIIFGKGYPE